jgi:uncharacterized RDD family membrane protein YckC
MDLDQRYLEQMAPAGRGDPFSEPAPPGFHSAEDRRRLKSRALKTAITAAVLDVVAPVILIFGVFFSIFSSACDRTFVEGAVVHQGQIYYARSSDDQLLLMRTAPDGVGGVEEVASADVKVGWLDGRPRLLADGRRLLLVTRGQTFSYAGAQLARVRSVEGPGQARPFAFRGKTAVARYDYGDELVAISTLQGSRWRRAQSVALVLPDGGTPGRIEAHERGGTLHLFTRTGGTIYHCAAIPGGGAPAPCEAVEEGDDNWSAALVDGAPALFQLVQAGEEGSAGGDEVDEEEVANDVDLDDDGPPMLVLGRLKGPRGWREILREPVKHTLKIAAITAGRGRVALLAEAPMGDLRLLALRDGKLESNRRLAGRYPLYITVIVLSQVVPFILAPLVGLVIGLSMRRARIRAYRSATGGAAEHGSLLRRGVAQGLDMLFFLAPLALLIPMIIRAPDDEAQSIYLCLGLLAWNVPLLLIFSFLEGRWGLTPGKWLLGLRVLGDDLRPCGFGRALLRNVLLAADGALVYLVGMVVIALSARQQRLGDLAASTVVVRTGSVTVD